MGAVCTALVFCGSFRFVPNGGCRNFGLAFLSATSKYEISSEDVARGLFTTTLKQNVLHQLEQFLHSRDPTQFGTRFFKDPDGQTHLTLTAKNNWQSSWVLNALLHPNSPALLHAVSQVALTPSQAKDLQLEWASLWRKYYFLALEQPNPATQPFVLGLSLAPYSSTTR
jgi:hypothetical protein